MTTYEQVFENSRKWAAQKKASDHDFFKNLAKGQNPEFLYIGCSDSRVTAEDLMGVEAGEVFVHRNIGNVISNTDLNAMGVIEFAVAHLQVRHIVVCGHTHCGGVRAAMQARDYGILNPWLRNISDVYRLHKLELDAIEDEEERYSTLVKLNVEEQCINVLKLAVVQKAFLKTGFPLVHGWVFHIKTGLLEDLNIDIHEKLKGVQEIYNLGIS